MRAQPHVFVQRRLNVGARVGRSRPEMAADLVRLEYERTRLERTLSALDARRSTVIAQLQAVTDRSAWIRERLSDDHEIAAAPQPVRPPVGAPGLGSLNRRGQK